MSAPVQVGWRFECPVCGNAVFEDEAPICRFCGEPLDWMGEIPTKEERNRGRKDDGEDHTVPEETVI